MNQEPLAGIRVLAGRPSTRRPLDSARTAALRPYGGQGGSVQHCSTDSALLCTIRRAGAVWGVVEIGVA
jgi:hypothetical protein